LNGAGYKSPQQQIQNDQANQQYQRQQIVSAAQKAAAQAAEYAKQAAPFNNEAAREAASYAEQAGDYARQAAYCINDNDVNSPMLEQYAAKAKQAATNAKQAAAQAATQAEIDSSVTKLENERDEAIAELKAKYAPNIASLESQASIPRQKIQLLEQKAAEINSQRSQSETENAHLRAKQLFQPKDPWRLLDGKIYNAKDQSWVHFTGQVLEVKPNGILVHGDFGPPLEAGFGERNYFVDNFPVQTYPMADGESIMAMPFGLHRKPQRILGNRKQTLTGGGARRRF
jgi:hypothetical protein